MDWKGFKLPMGFFLVWHEDKFRFGKCDPITKEMIEWYDFEEKITNENEKKNDN